MKKTMKKLWLALAAVVSWVGAAVAADIQYVADNGGGEYSGAGYGISVSVSAPASGAVVKYSESETGPWQDEPITYKDVCDAKPIWFQISATGYTTVTDARTVTVTPKTLTSDFVWLVLPTEDYVYDGTEKKPGANCGDGDPSIITENDFDVSYSDNKNAGTAKATFTGKGNYTGTVEEEFEILKADNEWTTEPAMAGWTYGQAASEPTSAAKDGVAAVTYGTAGNPGSLGDAKPSLPGSYVATFTVPESQNYKALTKDVDFTITAATVQYVADDVSGTYSGAGYGIAATISVSAPATGAAIKYAESETGPWQEEPITYKDVCDAKPIWFQISATGYTTVTDSRTVTVTPKTLTSDFVWLVLPTEDYVYDGAAKTPDAACGDGDPSIITPNDFDVSYSDNVNAGTAKATFTGKGNYTGTVEEEFEIQKADNEWTTEPAMAGWTYGQAASEPTSAAKVGTAVVTYGTSGNPGSLGDTKPTLPGSYVATFTVAESQNYKALTKDVDFTITAATVQYVADDVSGVYSGAGYGIAATISVSAPASGASIKYAESETGPWQEEPITYKDVCDAKPIWFQISATGYTTVTDSRTVTIAPKTLTSDFVWLVLPTEDYVYDSTAKTPDAACGDGDPSIITPNDFDVSYSDNVDAGTAKATFTGKGNYTGTVEEEFEIQKADNEWTTEPAMAGWTYGQAASEPTSAAKVGTAAVTYGTAVNPGSLGDAKPTLPGSYVATFTVPESQNYKALTKDVDFTITAATVQYVADDVSGEYNGTGYGIAATISVSAPASGATVKYAASEEGPWQTDPILYTNACAATPIFFEISATGYTTVTNSRTVTITPKTLTSDFVWLVLPTKDYVYDGAAKTPDAACGDGDPSIITPNDFDVSYSDNVNAGTAKATFTGKGNYTGTVEEEFEIQKANYGTLSVQWDYAGEFAYDRTEKTVTVVGTLPSGVSVASYTGNKATLPGSYTAHVVFNYDTTNYNEPTLDDLSWKIKSAEETTLRKIFDEPPAIITPDGDGWKVTLTGDMTGPIDIPDNLGHVTIDLNGYKITGPDGAVGSETAPGGDGTPAIRIVPSGSDDGAVTRISLVTSGGNSLVKGGDGGSGNPGGNGAPAIKVLDGTRDGVLIDVGAGVTVQGGVGGKGLGGGDDGDDGVPIDGGIGDVQGTLIRARVTPPVIAAKEYTGSAQVADVPASPRWSTVFNEGGTAVATYIVALELTDPVRYKWADTDNATLYLSFNITKAAIDISAVGWNYSEPLPYTAYPQEVMLTNLPAGVTATYTGNKATETGTYTAHATLNYNTDNFVVAAVPDCVWTIKPAVPIDGGNTDSLGGSTINYSGIYDGEAHGISVILRDPRPAGACVRYSRSKNGPYTDENPLFTDVCRETVWYLVTADHYEALTNSATVTIDPKPFTAGLVKHKGLKDVVENGVSKIVPTFVIEDNWPCKVEERDWELVDWTPRVAGGGTAVLCGRSNYTGQVTVEIGNEMTVLFDAVYGADRESLRVFTTQEPGKPYVFPTEPSYHGHAFLGWFTDREGGMQIVPGTIVSLADPDTLYARWTVKTFHMSYELNGGTGDIEDFDAEYGSAFGTMPIPKKPGYMFDGWWTTADFQNGTKVSEGDGVPFRDTTLFAKWERRRLWYHDTAFHLEKAETWNGYVVDPAAGDVVAGTIQVKAGKPNKKTGLSKLNVTVQLSGGKKKKLKGSTFDGTFTGDLDGRALYIRLGYSSLSGTFGGYALDGTRNVFTAKDADSKIVAARALNRWQGTYVVAWPGVSGWNGLSLEVKTKGKVKASGTLADGTKVSATTQLLVGERECAIAVSWTKKTASVACLVWLCEDGTLECANLPGGVSSLIANARSGAYLQTGAKLHVDTASLSAVVPGLQENLLPDGMEVRMNGTKFDVDKAGHISVKNGVIDLSKAGTNPSGLKLNYKVKDCTFKGSFNGYVLSGDKLKKVRVQVSGVVLGRVGYGTATVKKVGIVPVTISP